LCVLGANHPELSHAVEKTWKIVMLASHGKGVAT
jgi:hypothetical protein